ncbi:hypothetical protein [Microbacterium sp.]|uniref:hypothetical protein n=1 Tax=Microbacterium sp. TaxID=51671 RepID=UPI003242E4CD
MGTQTWREMLRGTEPAPGLPELFDELERSGWYPRSRVGDYGIRFWPDEGRKKQIMVDTRYPLNEHKLEGYREHTGLDLHIQIEEGGNR